MSSKTILAAALMCLLAYVNASYEQQVSQDVLGTPEWLQDIPEESKLAKYRKRRFVNFPTGSKLDIEILLTIPVEGLSDSGNLILENNLSFKLPNDTDFVIGRSLSGADPTRADLYRRFESFISGMGYDGHACTLRTICEVAELPFEHGLVGEIVNVLLTVTAGPSSNHIDGDDEYALAEYYGRHHGSCHAIYPACPMSFANLVSSLAPFDV